MLRLMFLSCETIFSSLQQLLSVCSHTFQGQYFISWDGGMKSCEGMEKQVFDLGKLVVEKKNKTVLALVGDVGLTEDSSDAVKV